VCMHLAFFGCDWLCGCSWILSHYITHIYGFRRWAGTLVADDAPQAGAELNELTLIPWLSDVEHRWNQLLSARMAQCQSSITTQRTMIPEKILHRTCIGPGATLLSLMEPQWVLPSSYISITVKLVYWGRPNPLEDAFWGVRPGTGISVSI